MKAVRIHELTGPSALRVDEIPTPSVGSGEIAVDVRAAGVNFPDVLLSYGKYQFKPAPPFIPGGEIAGVVREVGEGVTSVQPGDRVAATMIAGAFAETVIIPELAAVKIPERISFETAAATLLTYLTTIHALVDRAALQPKETLLVLGASGGVGTSAIHLGKLLGARVIAAASSPEKLAFCKAQGADEGIDYDAQDLKERVRVLTNGRGADVIYDPVGGDYAEPALRAIGWQGRYLVIGFAAGEIPRIPLNLTLLKGCQIIGVFWGQFAMREPELNRRNGERIFEWIESGKLTPHIHSVLPFSQATDALVALEERTVRGKIVLVPDAPDPGPG